jgi:hypothetical protein
MICRQCHQKPATKRGTFCSRPCQWANLQARQQARRAAGLCLSCGGSTDTCSLCAACREAMRLKRGDDYVSSRRLPRAVCACGCGRLCKKAYIIRAGVNVPVRFYDKDCYTRSGERSQRMRDHNARVTYLRRNRRYGAYLDRLPKRSTRGELLAVIQEIVSYYVGLERERGKNAERMRHAQKRERNAA